MGYFCVEPSQCPLRDASGRAGSVPATVLLLPRSIDSPGVKSIEPSRCTASLGKFAGYGFASQATTSIEPYLREEHVFCARYKSLSDGVRTSQEDVSPTLLRR